MTNPDNAGGLPLLQFAVFDEFGKGADDRVWDYGRLCFEAGRELCRAAPAGGDGLAERICDYLCDQEYDIGGRDELLAHIRNAMRTNEADGGRMSDELFAELELSVKQADKIIRSDKGCGACGDGRPYGGDPAEPRDDSDRYDSAPAGSGEAGGWLLDGCLIYRLSDGRNQTNTHEINVTMWDGSRELAVRDKAAAALLRKLQQGAE